MKNWDDEILKAIAHPVRRRIIESLREKKILSFNGLLECVDIDNHGKFGFHLRALKGLVEREPSINKYRLTEKGQLAGELIWDIAFIISRGGRDLQQEPTRYVRRLTSGDHAFLLYDAESAKREICFSFLEAGLPRGEAVAYFVKENKLDSESRAVQKYGVSAEYFHNGAITVASAEEWYLKRGETKAETIMANLLALAKEVIKKGFKGMRVAGEMDVFFDNGKWKELLTYEIALGKTLPSNICALCLYDVNKLDEKQVTKITRCHGHLVSKDIAWKIV